MMVILIYNIANFQKRICQSNKNMINIQNKLLLVYLLIGETVNNKIFKAVNNK